MKKKNRIIFIILLAIPILLLIALTINTSKTKTDENILYTKQFNNTVLKFQKYDDALGQNIIVGVEKSMDKGITYTKITEEPITVSQKARFLFMNESLGFAISTDNVIRSNNFIGFKVTQNGGKTFTNAQFNYDNLRIELITILDYPYYDEGILKLKCSVYDVKKDHSGYQDIEIIFSSSDNGLTWNYEKEL